MKFQAIKGVRDILPPESGLWNRVEQTAREVFGTFGFAEILLPIFELTELFARSVGQDTDIVSKEMYSFIDHPVDLPTKPIIGEMVEYVQKVGRLMETGTVPRTDSNLSNLKFLTEAAGQIFPIEEKRLNLDKLTEFIYMLEGFQLGDSI